MCGRRDEGTNVTVLCGLVSGGHKSCSARYHTIYTRVSRFKGWIKKQIEGEAYHVEIRSDVLVTLILFRSL